MEDSPGSEQSTGDGSGTPSETGPQKSTRLHNNILQLRQGILNMEIREDSRLGYSFSLSGY